MRSGKMEFETLAKILLLTAFLIIVLLLFKGCMDAYRDLGSVGIKEYTCWATNVMKTNVVSFWPSACRTQIVKDKVDTKTLGNFMGRCWWQYGQGKWDLGGKLDKSLGSFITSTDIVYTCYSFMPKEDIKIDELKTYMEEHNPKGEKVKAKDSMWNYLQILSQGDNICFDEKDKGVLKKGEVYFIKFVDDRAFASLGESDLLLISSDKNFLEWLTPTTPSEIWNWFTDFFKKRPCYKYGTVTEPVSTSNKFSELTKKIEACKNTEAKEECYCDVIELSALAEEHYDVFGKFIQEEKAQVMITKSKMMLESTFFTSPKGPVKLKIVCPGQTEPSKWVNAMIFDTFKTTTCQTGDKYCCEMKGLWYLTTKEEEKDMNGYPIRSVTFSQSAPAKEIQKCGSKK